MYVTFHCSHLRSNALATEVTDKFTTYFTRKDRIMPLDLLSV